MRREMKTEQFEIGESSTNDSIVTHGVNKWVSILDFIIRVFAFIGTLASAITMGTTGQTLSISTQFVLFRAQYNDLPSFMFFVISNSIVCAYLVLSLPISFFHIIKSEAKKSRIILVIFDTVMLALLTSGASAATAIVYLAHKGNNRANWNPFCQQFNSFCNRISASLIGSFLGIILFILLISTSVVAVSRR